MDNKENTTSIEIAKIAADKQNGKRLIPVTKWEEYHPWPSTAGLRYLIFNEKRNGFSMCVHRAGRRVLIDEEKFFEWVTGKKKITLNLSDIKR